MPPPKPKKMDYRDISLGLQKLRDFLLGRKHHLHIRFPPEISARSQPPPRIPRAPEIKLFNNYYCDRNPFDAVQQPVAAPSVLQGLAGQPKGTSDSKGSCENKGQAEVFKKWNKTKQREELNEKMKQSILSSTNYANYGI